jgi:hypothetical protein
MQKTEKGQTVTFVMAMVGGKHIFIAGLDSGGVLQFADKAQDAPIIHFGGKLRMGLYTESQKAELVRSEKRQSWAGDWAFRELPPRAGSAVTL